MERKQYEMSPESLSMLLDAMSPTSVETPLHNRMSLAWQALGNRMGFEFMSARPIQGQGPRFFTAEPLEGFVEKVYEEFPPLDTKLPNGVKL